MATMIRDSESTENHLAASRRHMRLCAKVRGCDRYIKMILPSHEELKVVQSETKFKKDASEDAHDFVVFSDQDLDNCIITVFEKCRQWDRDNPSARIMEKIFPEGKFGRITRLNSDEAPAAAEQLALRVQTLGISHAVFPLAAEINTRVQAYRDAKITLNNSINDFKKAVTEEEIAQAKLRKQYETNYLEARKELGRKMADRLFPRAKIKSAGNQNTENGEKTRQ